MGLCSIKIEIQQTHIQGFGRPPEKINKNKNKNICDFEGVS